MYFYFLVGGAPNGQTSFLCFTGEWLESDRTDPTQVGSDLYRRYIIFFVGGATDWQIGVVHFRLFESRKISCFVNFYLI